jgi:hypothetical protein
MDTMFGFMDVFHPRRGVEDAPGVEALKKSDFTIKYTNCVVIYNLDEKTSSKGENN